MKFQKLQPKLINYRDYKHFEDKKIQSNYLENELNTTNLKRLTADFLISVSKVKIYWGFEWTGLAQIFPYGKNWMSIKRADINLIWKII